MLTGLHLAIYQAIKCCQIENNNQAPYSIENNNIVSQIKNCPMDWLVNVKDTVNSLKMCKVCVTRCPRLTCRMSQPRTYDEAVCALSIDAFATTFTIIAWIGYYKEPIASAVLFGIAAISAGIWVAYNCHLRGKYNHQQQQRPLQIQLTSHNADL
jgi:hypothetical protein